MKRDPHSSQVKSSFDPFWEASSLSAPVPVLYFSLSQPSSQIGEFSPINLLECAWQMFYRWSLWGERRRWKVFVEFRHLIVTLCLWSRPPCVPNQALKTEAATGRWSTQAIVCPKPVFSRRCLWCVLLWHQRETVSRRIWPRQAKIFGLNWGQVLSTAILSSNRST